MSSRNQPTVAHRSASQRAAAALALFAALLAISGCTAGSLFRSGGGGSGTSANNATASLPGETSAIDTDGLAIYLETMLRLIDGDSLTQAATFSDLEDAAEFAPTTTNRLLYALALALPNHSGSDPAAGAERLRDLIAAGDTLLEEERMLAQIQLQSANQLVILQTVSIDLEAQRLDALAARDAEHAAALQAAQTENARLRAELENATTMLDAITNIERSLSEREDNE
jgi:hypothetical protein